MTYPNEPQPPHGYGPPLQPGPPQTMSTGKKVGIGCIGIAGAVIILAVVGALIGPSEDKDGNTPAAITSSSAPAAQEDPKESRPATPTRKATQEEPKAKASSKPAEKPPAEADAETAALPNLVGRGLQDAQDTAQAAGFFLLRSHDLTGQGRAQVWDRNWKVCTQTPSAGKRPTDVTVDFGVVKLEEGCP